MQVTVHGNTVWKNPHGYLPGAKQPLLAFHASMSLMYLLLTGTWLALASLYRSMMAAPQHMVSVCVVLGLFEASLEYADIDRIQVAGTASSFVAGVSVAFACAYKAALRCAILLLARGRGTFRPFTVDRSCLATGAP